MYKRLLCAAAFASMATAAAGTSQTFNGSQTIGAASATYTIVTDGTMGTLQSSNILSWTATLTNGATTDTYNSANSSPISLGGNSLLSDGSNLYFNYGGTGFLGLFDNRLADVTTYDDYVCWQTGPGCFITNLPAVGINLSGGDGAPTPQYFSQGSGNQIIASVARGVPEPSSWAMTIVGFGVIGFAMRFQHKSVPPTPLGSI